MGNDVREIGARFIVEEPRVSAQAAGFAQAALGDRRVQEALSGHRWRLLHVEAQEPDDKPGPVAAAAARPAYQAVYFDYSRNQTVRVDGGAGWGGFQVRRSYDQPLPSLEEFEEAVELVTRSPVWGPLLRAGHVEPYDPMPPVRQPEGNEPVERTLYVGLASKERRFNRIVAVNMVRREVSSQPVTPRRSLAIQRTCGVPAVACSGRPRRGTAGTATIEWPAVNPVWRFQAIRPAASSGINASGVEIRNVFYRGRRVLTRGHMPILNVEYDRNRCGPYRDWMYEESCFDAVGTNIPGAAGFRWCSEPPQTIFESGRDGGNFVGVAVYETDEGNLGLLSVMRAGWYRYVMEWQFAPDGRILPRFRFAGVSNSCVCNTHHHHALWRLDFDIIDDRNVVEERVGTRWTPLAREVSRRRQANLSPFWRVRHPASGAGYEIIPGPSDSRGTSYSGMDLYALRYRASELDDRRSESARQTSTNLGIYLNNETISNQDVVVWYAAHFIHNVDDHDSGEVEVGPTLRPFNWPE